MHLSIMVTHPTTARLLVVHSTRGLFLSGVCQKIHHVIKLYVSNLRGVTRETNNTKVSAHTHTHIHSHKHIAYTAKSQTNRLNDENV